MIWFSRLLSKFKNTGLCQVPEGSQVLCVSHGGIKASSERHINVEPDSRPTAHLQRDVREA